MGRIEGRKRRGRPSRQEALAIDRIVLESARCCFLANGFVGTTMDAIALQAGVTKTTLYQRYPDKAALLCAVMQDRIANWSAIAQQHPAECGDTLDERLRHRARTMLRWNSDPEVRAFGHLISECWASARPVAVEMQGIRLGRMLDVLESDLVALGARNGVALPEPRLLAEIFMGMMSAILPHTHDDAPVRADRVVALFIGGLAAW